MSIKNREGASRPKRVLYFMLCNLYSVGLRQWLASALLDLPDGNAADAALYGQLDLIFCLIVARRSI